MIKGILFDVGGVLIDISNYNPSLEVARFYNADLKVAEKSFKQYIPLLNKQYPEERMWNDISHALQSDRKDIPYHILHENFSKSVKNNEKILDILPNLQKKGLSTAILSDTNPIHKKLLKHIYNHFDRSMVFLSCDIGFRKDSNKAFEFALNKMHLKPQEVLFIDDSEKNILKAQSLNFQTILAKHQKQVIDELKRFHLLK